MGWRRHRASDDAFEVRRWAPPWALLVVLVPLGLAVVSLVGGDWQMGLVCLVLGVVWVVRLGLLVRTVADAHGVRTFGSPLPWSVMRVGWEDIADLVVTSADLWIVPADGGRPVPAGGCRQTSPFRQARERRLSIARTGMLQHRPTGATPGPLRTR